MKKKTIILTIISVVCVWLYTMMVLGLMIFSPLIIVNIGSFFKPNPSEPEIKYAEFPFELVYTIDGEMVAVNDIYVCEFDGYSVAGDGWSMEKCRQWKGYIKGTGEKAVLLTQDEERFIYCFVGDADFYMNDEIYPEKRPLTPRVYDVDKHFYVDYMELNEIFEHYDIEIISWEFSEPIENTYVPVNDSWEIAIPIAVVISSVGVTLLILLMLKKRKLSKA